METEAYQDERIDDYFVNDLSINYKIWDSYNLFFNITNIFDEKYETVKDYSQLDRSFNIGLKHILNYETNKYLFRYILSFSNKQVYSTSS